jgi:hypothetical protein
VIHRVLYNILPDEAGSTSLRNKIYLFCQASGRGDLIKISELATGLKNIEEVKLQGNFMSTLHSVYTGNDIMPSSGTESDSHVTVTKLLD